MDCLHQIQRVLDCIERRLCEPLRVEELARIAGFSPWHFQRLFAAVVGESVGQFLRRRRLTAAGQALRASSRRVLDIALDHQFESREAFTRAFRAVFGFTPSEFRRLRQINWVRGRFALRPEQLQLLPYAASMKPALVELLAFSLVGFAAHFISALSPEANHFKIIPPLWHKLTQRRSEIAGVREPCSYGAVRCLPADKRSRDDELDYLAGVMVEAGAPVPPGMVRWNVPALTYAQFVHRGPISRLPETINFALGAWLPRSEYQFADGPELERYDERFRGEDRESELDYLLPVRRKGA